MASAQVYRFQRRVSSLQSHHELAARRHSSAVKNYENFSRSMMDSLIMHLAENDKKLKKTKRISKPRTALPQAVRSTRPGDVNKPVERYPTYPAFPAYNCAEDPCATATNYNMFSPHFSLHEPKALGNIDYDVRQPVIPSPNANNEPIFPPPTYNDPSGNIGGVMSHNSLLGPVPCEDYSNGKTCFTREYHTASQMQGCGFTRYDYFYPSNSRDLVYRGSEADSYCTDPNFHPALTQQPPNFSSHHQPLTQPSWDINTLRDRSTNPVYGVSFNTGSERCTSTCNGNYPDSYGYYATKPVATASHEYRLCMRPMRPDNLTVIPRTAGSNYPGINPILASTYPVAPINRLDKNYSIVPEASEQKTDLGSIIHEDYGPFTSKNMQVPDHSFSDMNYI